MVQAIGHKNQPQNSSKVQKKRINRKGFGMAKICMGMINLKTKEIHILTQTTIVFTTLIQKKRPSVTQKTQGLKVMLYRLSWWCKATRELREFQELKLQRQKFQIQIYL